MIRFIALAFILAAALQAQTSTSGLAPKFQGIRIEQRLNAQVPLDTVFSDETGASVPLRTYFGRKAVLLALVYYRCPMLCSQVLAGIVRGLRPLYIVPGRDFNVVAISFDPADTPKDATAKRADYSHRYSSSASTKGWHFLTGSPASIKAITEAVGFHYRWDPASKTFIHASGIMILTPEGRVSRYLYGVNYTPEDLKLSLIESSHNRIGSPVDEILLFCCRYDPKTGKYTTSVLDLLKIAAVLMIVLGGATLFLLWRRDLRQHRRALEERRP
jgi:protein SCO1/2